MSTLDFAKQLIFPDVSFCFNQNIDFELMINYFVLCIKPAYVLTCLKWIHHTDHIPWLTRIRKNSIDIMPWISKHLNSNK